MLSLYFLAFTGHIFGYFLGKLTLEELQPGRILLHILQTISILTLSITLLFAGFHPLFFLLGITAGFFFTQPAFYFGLANASVLSLPITLATTILTFLYGLPAGSFLAQPDNRKELLRTAFFYFLSLPLLFFPITTFISFPAGALLSISIKHLSHALPHRPRPRQRKRSHTQSH